MGHIIGVAGTATRDHFFHLARLERRGRAFWLAARGREFQFEVAEPVNGNMKICARFDPTLLNYADHKQFGGGGYNSAVEMKRVAPDVQIRYSDSGTWNDELEAELLRRGIGYRHRDVYPVLDNVVTRDLEARDKRIFKTAPPPHVTLFPLEDHFSWVTEGKTLLLNSDKHRPWITKLAGAAARGRLHLHVVLTPALPACYLLDAVVPYARLVVAALDELGTVLGFDVPNCLAAGVAAVGMLARRALSPVVHVTLGKEGVLVADPEEMTVLHVRLSSKKYREVQAHLRDHSRLCGCGDCYAGAVTLHMVAGRSVFGGAILHSSPFASAAIAGCAAAVRRLGYAGPLEPEDFEISVAGDLGDEYDGACSGSSLA